MDIKENQILEYINNDGFVSVTKDSPDDEQAFVRKLKAFGVLDNHKSIHQYNPTSIFYKHYNSLLAWKGKIEEYQFEDKSATSIVNNFNVNTISQFNQNSHQISFEQINNTVFTEALKHELSEEQLEIIKELVQSKSDKKTIIQTIGGFGKDILSNIIANVLTNPSLYS
ncbi:hypothetical protein [Flavobacterium ginsengiterrae]|uniref:Uncharacterized protein n=1 Tax=Flavobacterium ginsengiterrae TaxID=871695 RepID=A0ABP7G8N4_9FLAO